MEQIPLFHLQFLTVSELTRYLRQLIESDELLQEVWVEGEVSNLSRPASGHIYFTLKDQGASLRCVIWRSTAQRLRLLPQDGALVQAHGSIGVYEAGGQYQLYADLIQSAGEGALFQEFLRLKALLEAEGLFAPERKRAIPPWPRQIGIVTSPTGAALQDMLNTLRRRFPLAEVVLAPAPVQGDEAPAAIVAALQALNRTIHPDVILVARGGGSLEDLWAFNDERVARAIAASQAPVITGIGHETDFTLADFAADLRAPTPTAAAELAAPNREDLRLALAEQSGALTRSVRSLLETFRFRLEGAQSQLQRYSPLGYIRSERQRLDDLGRYAGRSILHRLSLQRALLSGVHMRLNVLSPQSALQRGFAIVTRHPQGDLVRSAAQVAPGTELQIRVAEGSFGAKVIDQFSE
ncbi:MAG: exodeoxyribonuclease VII large subunit [Chloroflexi bacterium]|nr:exodeoxyribonuclease VII large subunit [Chloroflexota bacterium]